MLFGKTSNLKQVQRKISQAFPREEAPEIDLLPEDQMIISKNMTPNPVAETAMKVDSFVPGADGYEIYLAYRRRKEHEGVAGMAQRAPIPGLAAVPWKDHSETMRLSPDALQRRWQFLNAADRVVTIQASCGSANMLDEVNQLLDIVTAILLDEPGRRG